MTNVRWASSRSRDPHVPRLDADPEQDRVRFRERRRPTIGDDREGAVVGGRIGLVERVDPFLEADAGRVRAVAVGDVPLGDLVRGGVDVEGKGRDAILAGVDRRVDPGILEDRAVVRRRGRSLVRVGWIRSGLVGIRGGLVVLRIGWALGRTRSCRRSTAAGPHDEGDDSQRERRLAHGATSPPRTAGTVAGRHGWDRRGGPTWSRSGRHECAVGPPV